MIVVDTNVVAGLYLGQGDPAGEHILRRDQDWAAPTLWRSEFRNVLGGEMRRGGLSLDRAIRIAGLAEARVRGREYLAPAESVLELVGASRCTAYDCEFVAVARMLGVPLVTSDRQVLAAFPDTAVSPAAFLAH